MNESFKQHLRLKRQPLTFDIEDLLQQMKRHEVAADRITPCLVRDFVELVYFGYDIAVSHDLKSQAVHIGILVPRPDSAYLFQFDRLERG